MTFRNISRALAIWIFSFAVMAKPGWGRGVRCGGAEGAVKVGPYCWVLGERGLDCNTVCNRINKKDKSPEHSTEALCRRLADEFLLDTGELNVTCQNTVGCHVFSNSKVERCNGTVRTNSSYNEASRFCACGE